MKSVIINGTTYNDVPSVNIPLSSGNGNATFYETSDADIDAGKVLQGYYGYGNAGKIQGSLTTVSVSQNATTKVLTIA